MDGQDEHLFLYLPQVKQFWLQWKQIWKAIYNQASQADTNTSVVGRFGVISGDSYHLYQTSCWPDCGFPIFSNIETTSVSLVADIEADSHVDHPSVCHT